MPVTNYDLDHPSNVRDAQLDVVHCCLAAILVVAIFVVAGL